MPVTQARLPGFQSAKSARWYQALIGPIQATGSAGGFDWSKMANAVPALETNRCFWQFWSITKEMG